MSTYAITPLEPQDPMNRICTNCGERYGEHFRPNKGFLFCTLLYYEHDKTREGDPNPHHVFIDSGEFRIRDMSKNTKKDTNPNFLFKGRG